MIEKDFTTFDKDYIISCSRMLLKSQSMRETKKQFKMLAEHGQLDAALFCMYNNWAFSYEDFYCYYFDENGIQQSDIFLDILYAYTNRLITHRTIELYERNYVETKKLAQKKGTKINKIIKLKNFYTFKDENLCFDIKLESEQKRLDAYTVFREERDELINSVYYSKLGKVIDNFWEKFEQGEKIYAGLILNIINTDKYLALEQKQNEIFMEGLLSLHQENPEDMAVAFRTAQAIMQNDILSISIFENPSIIHNKAKQILSDFAKMKLGITEVKTSSPKSEAFCLDK